MLCSERLTGAKRVGVAIGQHGEMTFRFELVFEGAGWLHATVESGDEAWTAQASYMTDAPEDLLDAVLAICCGALTAEAVWWEEPQASRPFENVHWRFRRVGDQVTVQIVGSNGALKAPSDEGQVFESTTDVDAFGRITADAFLMAVEGLSDADYRHAWQSSADRRDVLVRVQEIRAALQGEVTAATQQRLAIDRESGFGRYASNLSEA